MAGFNTHLNVTLASTTIIISAFHANHMIPDDHSLITASLIGIMGGLLPDLDSDTSKPLFLFFNAFSFLIAIICLSIMFKPGAWVELFYIGMSIFIFFRYVVIKLFMHLTVHRGIFHSIPSALLFGTITAIISSQLFNLPSTLSWAYAFLISFNYTLHLLLDELISFNLLGIKMKRSFGTALKLFSVKNIPQYSVMYILLLISFIISPEHHSFLTSFHSLFKE